jgi:hypothetical protein
LATLSGNYIIAHKTGSLTITPLELIFLMEQIHQPPVLYPKQVCSQYKSQPTSTHTHLCIVAVPSAKIQYGHSWVHAAVDAWKATDYSKTTPWDELKWYLDSPLEHVDDVIALLDDDGPQV